MATSMIKLTENDFLDKNDFITKQCNTYAIFNSLKHGDDPFNGKKCEDVLALRLRKVLANNYVKIAFK